MTSRWLPALLVAACGGSSGPTEEIRAYCGSRDAAAVEARITELLGQLTLDEKIALMQGAAPAPTDGVWLVEGNARLGIPGLHMLDGPRGVSAASGKTATSFPVAMMRGATWDPALEERVGRAIARELVSAGGDVLLAPTMNILRHPRWGRAQETYSEDVHHLGEMALAFVRGVQAEGVLASAKHYAANSIEDTRFTVDVHLDERTLREIYLPHFERVVREGPVASVMTAYNSVNGLHCDQQTHLVAEILKGEWGFAGFVESDWILGTHGDVASVLAGLDMEMPLGNHFGGLAGAVTAGSLDEARIDEAVRRILRAQLCFGLDERERVADDPPRRETLEHLALAREVARRGLVLLKNDGVLPFGTGVASIVVAGRNADVANIGDIGGSSGVRPTETVTALAGLTERGGTVTHLPGTTLGAAEEALVSAADMVVVVTGLQAGDEGEGLVGAGDRRGLAVPPDEVAFIRALAAIGPPVVVILEGGSAFVTSDWDGDVAAVAHAFYPGSQGGRALADILFGDAAPTGRLPFSMPEAETDLPPFDNTSAVVDYGYFHGYRHLAHDGVPARYPFGFGLSYTTFARSDLSAFVSGDTITARVTVRNTGPVAGTDTVEVYVAATGSLVERAPYDLRAFGQVTLAPGEARELSLPFRVSDLAYYDEARRAWVVEPLAYELRVASHAEDPGLVAGFRVE